MTKSGKGKKYFLLSLGGIILGFSLLIIFNWLWDKSSTSESCMSCHYHTESDMMWKQSMHHNSNSGVKTDCAACHLPPKGTLEYTKAKIATGMQDIWSYLTKDKEEIDWESNFYGIIDRTFSVMNQHNSRLMTELCKPDILVQMPFDSYGDISDYALAKEIIEKGRDLMTKALDEYESRRRKIWGIL